MTVETIATRLARIWGDITGITKAFDLDEIPNTLQSAQLPAVICVPGEAEYANVGSDTEQETRTWYMLLYIAPVNRPVGVAQRMGRASPFFSRVRAAFAARDGLESLSGVLESELLSDSGTTQPLQFGGDLYTGIEFRLRTVELANITRVDYA